MKRSLSNLAVILVLQAAGAGFASPSVIVVPNVYRYVESEWLPKDNQTLYHLRDGEIRRLELNRTERTRASLSITVSPCTKNLIWSVYHSQRNRSENDMMLVREYRGSETATFSAEVTPNDRYVIELVSGGGSMYCAVWARGEAARGVRLRLRRSRRRRLTASWDPSPIDPQATSYCVVASRRKPYTSLCAARYDLRQDNVVEAYDVDVFGNNKSLFRRKKFSRSTNTAEEDPIIDCVGDRTHHTIDDLDSTKAYNIAVFGIGPGRVAGELQATGYISPKYSRAQTLKDGNLSSVELKSGEDKMLFKYKAPFGSTKGVWLAVRTCGGSIDVEISFKGRVLHSSRNIASVKKIYVSTPPMLSYQDTTYESSSSSAGCDSTEEWGRVKYLIKITTNERDSDKPSINLELVASENRWRIPYPELQSDEVREVRPARECNAVTVAFIPAVHKKAEYIRYCLTAQEVFSNIEISSWCSEDDRIEHVHNLYCSDLPAVQNVEGNKKVEQRRIDGLRPGSKYFIRVSAAIGSGRAVHYDPLVLHTDVKCKD